MANEHLSRIFRHNRWANRLIMDACRDLNSEQLATSVDGTYGALGPTLAHLASAESGYVWRIDQTSERFRWDEEQPVPAVDALTAVLETSGSRLIELAATIADDQIVSYLMEGEERRWPAWVVLGQAIDHGREHRSHAATVLTQLGIEPPDMDMWAYGEAVQAGQAD
ncbi:MAG TPA: DinB family protein [Acidimicrobiia bacterium]